MNTLTSSSISNREILSLDEVIRRAPAIGAEQPSSKVSDRYQHLPTKNIVETLMSQGIMPVNVQQRKSRTEEGRMTTKHLIRFTLEGILPATVGRQEIPEIVLINSHDRTSTYRFALGLFRLVCANGLIVCDRNLGEVRLRHQGEYKANVMTAIDQIVGQGKLTYDNIDKMKSRVLSMDQKLELANKAMQIRWADPVAAGVSVFDILRPRRAEDAADDLWTVGNVVQENIMRGGLYMAKNRKNPDKVRKVREVTAIEAVFNMNTKVFEVINSFV